MANRVSFPENTQNKDYTPAELRLKAEAYCARAEHCADDVRNKLIAWGGGEEVNELIISALYENNYLNDMRYCQAYVHDKLLYQHWGKVKIRMMLQAHHLPKDCISAAIEDIDDTDYMNILRQVLAQKKNASREQQIRFLLQRGFEYRDIHTVLGNK